MERVSETKLIGGVLSITVGFFLLIKTALIIRSEDSIEAKIFFAVLGIFLFILGTKWLKMTPKIVAPVEKEADVILVSQASFPIYEKDVRSETTIHQFESGSLTEIAV